MLIDALPWPLKKIRSRTLTGRLTVNYFFNNFNILNNIDSVKYTNSEIGSVWLILYSSRKEKYRFKIENFSLLYFHVHRTFQLIYLAHRFFAELVPEIFPGTEDTSLADLLLINKTISFPVRVNSNRSYYTLCYAWVSIRCLSIFIKTEQINVSLTFQKNNICLLRQTLHSNFWIPQRQNNKKIKKTLHWATTSYHIYKEDLKI